MSSCSSRDDTNNGSSLFTTLCNDCYNPWKHSIYHNIISYGLLKNKGMKSLGQNFLCDESLLDKIACSAMPLIPDTTIIEIGAGPCGLTRSIVKSFPKNKLLCIEKDVRFKPLHDNMLKHTEHDLVFEYADALKYDLNFDRIAIIANLPYNVGTVLLVKWLTQYIDRIEKMVLLFQKEVAERICAKVGNKQYGSISVLAQLLCDVEVLFDISNKAFIPSPKVTSSLVLLVPRRNYCPFEKNDIKTFATFVNNCFQFRRKVIYSTLKRLYPSIDTMLLLSQLDIGEKQRPETITPKQYAQIFASVQNPKAKFSTH